MSASSEPLVQRVFRALQDEQFHSGAALAEKLGVSRGGVWKAVQVLEEGGARIDAVSNRGYRLRGASGALDVERILNATPAHARKQVCSLDVVWSIESTNAALMAVQGAPPGNAIVMLAENQTAGRGRRGRTWFAPLGGAICISLGWVFREMPRDFGALSLAIGVGVMRALEKLGVPGVGLKWPNDLLVQGRKLGGILIEMRTEANGAFYVVIGLGLNVRLDDEVRARVTESGTDPIDLASLSAHVAVDRNAIVAALLEEWIVVLQEFEASGLAPFNNEWRSADVLRNKEVTLSLADRATRGIARGIDSSGALLVETPTGLEKFVAGEVTVRAAT